MLIDQIAARKLPDGECYVIIEIPMNAGPIKYEMDKETGAIFVDRFMQTTMSYPCNYGFIPGTLSRDGDPVDVLVISQCPVVPGAVIRARPVGVLMMEDESGVDEKILAVPVSKLDPFFDKISDIEDVNQLLQDRIVHFFEHYKHLEKGKWVKIQGWQGKLRALELIAEGVQRA